MKARQYSAYFRWILTSSSFGSLCWALLQIHTKKMGKTSNSFTAKSIGNCFIWNPIEHLRNKLEPKIRHLSKYKIKEDPNTRKTEHIFLQLDQQLHWRYPCPIAGQRHVGQMLIKCFEKPLSLSICIIRTETFLIKTIFLLNYFT